MWECDAQLSGVVWGLQAGHLCPHQRDGWRCLLAAQTALPQGPQSLGLLKASRAGVTRDPVMFPSQLDGLLGSFAEDWMLVDFPMIYEECALQRIRVLA